MEIQVARLRETLGILKPAVPRKTSLPILKNVLVKDGQMVATDLDTMVIINQPEAADESFLLPFADVLKMLQYVPGHEYLTVNAPSHNQTLKLSWSEGSATYPTQDLDNYPLIPDIVVKDEATIDGDTFIAGLRDALPYAATGADRPVLNGVTVLFGQPIEVTAGDGFRMAHIVLPLQFPGEYTTIIPASSVSTLMHLLAKTPRYPPKGDALVPIVMAKRLIQVALDGKRGLKIVFGPTASVIVKLVEGNPPAWLKLIPKEEPVLKVQFFAQELEAAVRRVSNVAHQNNDIVRFQIDADSATVSAKADEQEVSSNVSVLDAMGTPNRVALNVGYLTEYLSNKDGIVSMSWTGNSAPVSFQHGKSPRVLIMPMQAHWDGDPPAEEQPTAEASPETPETTAEAQSEEEIPQEPQAEPEASSQVNTEPAKKPSRRGKKKT